MSELLAALAGAVAGAVFGGFVSDHWNYRRRRIVASHSLTAALLDAVRHANGHAKTVADSEAAGGCILVPRDVTARLRATEVEHSGFVPAWVAEAVSSASYILNSLDEVRFLISQERDRMTSASGADGHFRRMQALQAIYSRRAGEVTARCELAIQACEVFGRLVAELDSNPDQAPRKLRPE